MILELNTVKEFLRLESDYIEEDSVLQLMINNAEIYVENAIGAIDVTNEKLVNQVKLIMLVLITDFYENRELTGKQSEKVRYTVKSIVTQLQYCYESSDIV